MRRNCACLGPPATSCAHLDPMLTPDLGPHSSAGRKCSPSTAQGSNPSAPREDAVSPLFAADPDLVTAGRPAIPGPFQRRRQCACCRNQEAPPEGRCVFFSAQGRKEDKASCRSEAQTQTGGGHQERAAEDDD